MAAKDFSFIAEDNLSYIFGLLSRFRVKVNMMQNAAISFSVCADNHPEKIHPMMKELEKSFTTRSNDQLNLLTIRHYTESEIEKYAEGKEIFLEQKSRLTVQIVLKAHTG
jgi:aspartate kinase